MLSGKVSLSDCLQLSSSYVFASTGGLVEAPE
jgi:hypothetical protein